jgi:hypothetical protein
LLADAESFEEAAQALVGLAAASSSTSGLEALLCDGVLKKLLKGDAGCGVLMALLVAVHRAGLQLPDRTQEAVAKVRHVLGLVRGAACATTTTSRALHPV